MGEKKRSESIRKLEETIRKQGTKRSEIKKKRNKNYVNQSIDC